MKKKCGSLFRCIILSITMAMVTMFSLSAYADTSDLGKTSIMQVALHSDLQAGYYPFPFPFPRPGPGPIPSPFPRPDPPPTPICPICK